MMSLLVDFNSGSRIILRIKNSDQHAGHYFFKSIAFPQKLMQCQLYYFIYLILGYYLSFVIGYFLLLFYKGF